ncbi:hypothetical protein GCM10011491_44770 [Brucella endophytica]|uniref:Uncharacterized protein n=1 Tax=Brucella endophytica TaxID=1963359 RepID=A0A916SQ36_9HYPH|nr:hypothetical protein [Brucella endophytica]GGB11913.1 hypothetical protein GCM10011491_44770 [Brucella endophytica]
MTNTVTWMTAGTVYPRPGSGTPREINLWLSFAEFGPNGNVKVEVTGPAAAKGVKTVPANGIAAIRNENDYYVASMKIEIPSTLVDTDEFTLTATPLTSNLSNDGQAIPLGPCTTKEFDETNSGQNVLSTEPYATTPGDPTSPGNYYTVFLNIKDSSSGFAGAAAELILDPPGTTAKLYDAISNQPLLEGLPGVFYVNSNTNGQTRCKLATTEGVNIQIVKVTGSVVGLGTEASANFFFSTTPDSGDQTPGWVAPTLPDAAGGNILTLDPGQTTYRLTVPVNDEQSNPPYRGVIINDTSAFLYTQATTSTLDNESVTKLVLNGGPKSNWFTVFSQDNQGNISCSPASQYEVKGAPGNNLPDISLTRSAPEPLVDPFPSTGIITKNTVNAHDGLGLILTDIQIAQLGLSDKGKAYDKTLAITATSVVFTFYMNGYESSTSVSIRSQAYNKPDELNTPIPTLAYDTNPPTKLVWSTSLVSMIYALSIGWYQNSSVRPPRKPCGFEYYIQQMQNSVPHKWYSKIDTQRALPAGWYEANIPA